MTAPTIRDIERAMCCPRGTCISPNDCYAEDRSRSYPVQIQEAAKAVAALYAPTGIIGFRTRITLTAIVGDTMADGADGR